MYDLPSGEADVSGTLVDLFDDEDLEMMWEELDVMLVGVLCCAVWAESGSGCPSDRGSQLLHLCRCCADS